MAPKPTGRIGRKKGGPHHRHSKAHCLKVLRRLSAYMEDDLPSVVCREIRRHVGACPNCEKFLTSLRQTVNLCSKSPAHALSSSARARLLRDILKAGEAA